MVVGPFECRVQPPCTHVLLDLPVPQIGHELLEPLGEASQLGRRKAGNRGFKFFNAHARRIRRLPVRGKETLRFRHRVRERPLHLLLGGSLITAANILIALQPPPVTARGRLTTNRMLTKVKDKSG